MTENGENLNLGEGANRFLASLTPEERNTSQQEVYAFVRWYGWDKPFDSLTAPAVGNYAERLSLTDTDHAKTLGQVRAFLSYAREQGWTSKNMSVHLKSKKGKTKGVIGSQDIPETHALSRRDMPSSRRSLVS